MINPASVAGQIILIGTLKIRYKRVAGVSRATLSICCVFAHCLSIIIISEISFTHQVLLCFAPELVQSTSSPLHIGSSTV